MTMKMMTTTMTMSEKPGIQLAFFKNRAILIFSYVTAHSYWQFLVFFWFQLQEYIINVWKVLHQISLTLSQLAIFHPYHFLLHRKIIEKRSVWITFKQMVYRSNYFFCWPYKANLSGSQFFVNSLANFLFCRHIWVRLSGNCVRLKGMSILLLDRCTVLLLNSIKLYFTV